MTFTAMDPPKEKNYEHVCPNIVQFEANLTTGDTSALHILIYAVSSSLDQSKVNQH